MPRTQPPSVGNRPAQAQVIMDTVYERLREEGYPKDRAAMQAWGAVHRAGYDPDHLGDLIAEAQDLVKRMKVRDRWIDETYGPLSEEYATADPASRIIRGARRAVRTGRTAKATLQRLRFRPKRPTKSPVRTPTKPTTRSRLPGPYADPARLVKPIDLPGYNNLVNVRLVPKADAPGYYPVRGLVEGQIVEPQHQFLKMLDVIEGDPSYSHVELTDENGDEYLDRVIVRGPKDARNPAKANVGLFIDIAKPLKSDRLLMENWRIVEE
jgi:hypothetical protein